MSAATTVAPSAIIWPTGASPMPPRAPVTTATLPSNLFAIIGNAATGPAQSEGRTNNGGKSRMIQRGNGLFQRMRNARTCGFEADFVHRIAEFQAIPGLVDSRGIRADHLTTIFLQRAVIEKPK